MQKLPFFDQNHGLNALKKCQFFLNSCFYSLEGLFFDPEYRKRHFPGLFGLKKKVRKIAIFGLKSWVTRWENVNFSTFEILVFIA